MTEHEKAKAFNQEIKEALQLIFDELNYGQRQKLAKNENVIPLIERYGIEVEK